MARGGACALELQITDGPKRGRPIQGSLGLLRLFVHRANMSRKRRALDMHPAHQYALRVLMECGGREGRRTCPHLLVRLKGDDGPSGLRDHISDRNHLRNRAGACRAQEWQSAARRFCAPGETQTLLLTGSVVSWQARDQRERVRAARRAVSSKDLLYPSICRVLRQV